MSPSLPFINPGESRRIDCPECGGKNSFSISNNNGTLLYYCFRVNCNIKGKQENQLTVENIASIVNKDNHEDEQWKIPDYWISPLQNKECLSFMRYWKLLDCYADNRVSMYYDPKQHRCVFIIKDSDGVIHGATGRSLELGNIPKWYIYHISDCHFGMVESTKQVAMDYLGKKSNIMLVEDFISACVSSNIIASGSILGTSIPVSTIHYLKQFSKIFIALDPDATQKAIKIQKELNPYIDTKIIAIKKDLKYYSTIELQELKKELE